MRKKYIAIECENSKYCKDVPYISKKEFRKNEDNVIVGKTRLKKYKSSSEKKELDLLLFDNKEFEVKEKIFGFKKGYVFVGDNNFITLKRRIPFLLIFFIILTASVVFACTHPPKQEEDKPIEPPVQNEVIIPEEKEEEKEVVKEEVKVVKPNKVKPSPKPETPKEYSITFDANGGYGKMESIICKIDNICTLNENKFTKEGYTFVGWSQDKEGIADFQDKEELENLSSKSGDIITLYAIWEVNSYQITFLDYDESIIQQSELDYDTEIVIPEDPIRKGYTFTGWDKELSTVKEELVITALYDINSYDISYLLNGGTLDEAPPNYNVESEDIIIPSPEKIGYTFVGWTTSDNSEPIKDYKISTGSVDNIELEANYDANSYNLIFNSKDNNDSLIKREVKFDSEYGELPEVEKDGYTFNGWKNSNNEYVASDTLYNVPEDINLYAEWNLITYDINYNLNGGTLDEAPPSYTTESEDIIIPSPTKQGYNFIGWTTSDNSEPITDYIISKGSVGNKELTANFEPISYYISYNSSEGQGEMKKQEFIYNQTSKLIKNQFTKEGYTFEGWSTSINGDVIYKDEAEIYNITSKDDEVITLYAIWEIIKLDVKYYDLFGALLKSETVDYGNKSIAPEDPFIDGYTFTGWNPSIDVIKEDTIYKAQYTTNEYTIKYNLNTGKSDDAKEIKYNVESDAIILPTPTRTGYTFLGWTGSNGLKPQLEVVIRKGSVGNKTYKANWTSNPYKVSLNANGGVVEEDYIMISYNSLYGTIPSPSRVGYTFEGWYYNDTLITEDSLQNKEFDHELVAKWKVINYGISYELNGGSASSLVNIYNIETETFTLPIPTKKGYKFLGWTGSNGSTPSTNVSIVKGSIGEKSYTANWEIITYNISYDLGGGSTSSLTKTYNVESNTITLPTPTRTGYTFLGWTASNGSTPSTSVSIAKGSTGDKSYTANWKVIQYDITYNLAGGSASPLQTSYNVESNSFTLPTPSRTGYTFTGWSGTGLSSTSKNVTVSKGSTGNRSYTANWSVNYYTVNYYVQGSLWATRSVAYNTTPENLNAQSALDIYHKFNSWDGWVDKMPTNTVNLYANITESYCMLMTGHGPYGNAEGLLNVFKSAGWTGRIEEAPSAPGFYWVVTDYTLTRAQADIQREYIANHTNYTNYNFPYLYWVSVSCTNGIGDTWTRSVGTKKFTSQY